MACLLVVLAGSLVVQAGPAQAAGSIFKGSPTAVARRLCLAIPKSAVAALYSVPIGKPTTGYVGTCDFVPVGMAIHNDDSSPLFVTVSLNDYGSLYGTFTKKFDHKLTGIGDKAYWDWGQEQNADAPQVNAVKGKIDCMVTLNGEVDHTTLSYTESGGNPVVTNAAGEAFAKKLAAICSDMFKGK